MNDDMDSAPEWQRSLADHEIAGAKFDDAAQFGVAFCNGLLAGAAPADLLAAVTPASRSWWGDFSAARQKVSQIPDLGYGSIADRHGDDDTVAYFKLIPTTGGPANFQTVGGWQPINAAAILTLVNIDGRWLAHHLGDYVQPGDIPRA